MKYTDRVLKHPLFVEVMEKIKVLEASRIYCRHHLEHGIDVARMAWIYYLEDRMDGMAKVWTMRPQMNYPEWREEKEEMKDLIYTCALLHDLGRVAQYETGIHHSVAGIPLVKEILSDIQVPTEWEPQILDVVSEHSQGEYSEDCKNLEYYIMKADHDCRLCFACQAKDTCKWSEEEMNHTVES